MPRNVSVLIGPSGMNTKSFRVCPHPVEAFKLQVVHLVVQERLLRNVAFGAPALTHEDFFAGQLGGIGLCRVEPLERVELRRRREIDDVLHLSHHRNVIDAIRAVHALALRAHVVTIEVGGALLELRKVLDRSQRPLGAVDALIEQAAQAHRVESKSLRLRPDVRREVKRAVGVEVGVAARDTLRPSSPRRPYDPRSD